MILSDLFLSEYDESLSTAWTDTLAGNEIGFRKTSSIFRIMTKIADANNVDYILVDVGPNLGSLNLAVLLSCDHFLVPLVPDLYSLRGLENIGKTFEKWVCDWASAKKRFQDHHGTFPFPTQNGLPVFSGYINQQFNIYAGKETKAWKYWSEQVPTIIEEKLVRKLKDIDKRMVIDLNDGSHKLGDFKSYHSLAPKAQEVKKPIFELAGNEIVGVQKESVIKCNDDFKGLAEKIIKHIS